VITARYVVVLMSILCFSTAGAFVQGDAERMARVLTLGDPEAEALGKHRLTVDNVRKMFAVDRELFALMTEVPDLERRVDELARRIDPQHRLGDVTRSAQVYEGIPEIAQVLRTHKINGREYILTYAVAMVTAMTDDTLTYEAQREGRNEIPPIFMTQALKFWRSMDPALKAEAAAWKKCEATIKASIGERRPAAFTHAERSSCGRG
jgi:hypothetical protein